MAKKQDLKEVVSALEKIYDTLRTMRERHEAELKAVTEEVISAFRRIQEAHPQVREVMESVQDKEDELFAEARALVIEAGQASTSYLQRKLNIGYSRAARLMDLLEEAGVVGPGRGATPGTGLKSASSNSR